MKSTRLTNAVQKVVELKLQAIDRIIDDLVEPLEDVGNPEKLIKKPYNQWTPEDLALMIKIYGQSETSPLSNLIFRRKYEEVLTLEAEVK